MESAQTTQDFVQWILKTSKDGDVVVSLGNLLMLWLSLGKITFLTLSQKVPCFDVQLLSLILPPHASKEPVLVFMVTFS